MLPVPVVNQEANRGEPKQMLTTCLVYSLSLGDRKKKKEERDKKKERTDYKNSLNNQVQPPPFFFLIWQGQGVGKAEV